MKSQDDEENNDISTLLKKIKGIQAPAKESTGSAVAPPPDKKPGEGESDIGESGDFSALIEKLRLTNNPPSVGADQETPLPQNVDFLPEKKLAPGEPEKERSGDFSAVIRKLGMDSKATTGAEPETVTPQEKTHIPEEGQDDLDDLLEDVSTAKQIREPPDVSNDDVRAGQSKVMEQPAIPSVAIPPPEKKSPHKVTESLPEPIVEIIEEDPRESKTSKFFKKKKAVKSEGEEGNAADVIVSDADERIISADQISEYSGLILPKGATFQIDEINLHGRMHSFESTGSGSLPPELADVWKREFSSAGFKDLESELNLEKEKIDQAATKKSGFAALFGAIRQTTVDYDPKLHGPLVDLSFDIKPGVEEMEMYPVNEPYAYVRVIYDHSTHEYTYQVIEPVLSEPEKDLLKEIKERLFETLDINTKDISKEEARRRLRSSVDDILSDYGIKLSPVQREKILYNMHKDFLGDGLIDAIMHDKYIEDISCDGVNTPLFAFHASYESMKTTLMYHNAEELDSFVTKLAQRAGKYISIAEPILDATMTDGSRIQMTLGQEVTAHGSTFTIRKFKDEPITPTDLIEWHTFAPLSVAYIWLAVENGKSAIFAGGTASGKTTSLNAISLFIPPMAKIVSLEDTREVKLPHPNWIPSITRDSFDTAGRGEINMYELLRAAMRQRPEYIIVGEVRGKECQTLFQAMSTGHVTYSTIHADSVSSVVHRIENPPMDVPRNMLSALDIVCIQVQARMGGKRIRRNKQIVEILDIDPRTNELITNEVFRWRSATDEITYSGKSYILEDIMEARGWNENRMREELKRRQEVLEWMRIKKIRHYKDVAKILISYYREPEVVIERVRKDLYE
ncbi:MAG: type II/IV secretion system ATPase subunit [Methanoregula sp.]